MTSPSRSVPGMHSDFGGSHCTSGRCVRLERWPPGETVRATAFNIVVPLSRRRQGSMSLWRIIFLLSDSFESRNTVRR